MILRECHDVSSTMAQGTSHVPCCHRSTIRMIVSSTHIHKSFCKVRVKWLSLHLSPLCSVPSWVVLFSFPLPFQVVLIPSSLQWTPASSGGACFALLRVVLLSASPVWGFLSCGAAFIRLLGVVLPFSFFFLEKLVMNFNRRMSQN